jgi:2-succinyl-5-enolpyruvyl-6-hydroxy-3-cyclohexene-1-carboxylate synthase
MNTAVVKNVLQAIIDLGAREFCICPGSRNVSLIALIKLTPELQAYYFNDERSAAFFALGKSQASGKPVAIITTSGTAVSYLLGAAMEAYYTGIPLLLITADRPRRFRHTNAPQSCEQKGIYGLYTKVNLDLEGDEPCDLSAWDLASPVHINICLEEPLGKKLPEKSSLNVHEMTLAIADPPIDSRGLEKFLDRVHYPLTVVGGLKPSARESVMHFLNRLNIPVFLEGISGLREEPSLQHLRITRSNRLWEKAEAAAYPIDGILRIGGVPTFRLWRDLEDKEGIIQVYSINDVPFSGLSWGLSIVLLWISFFRNAQSIKHLPLLILKNG